MSPKSQRKEFETRIGTEMKKKMLRLKGCIQDEKNGDISSIGQSSSESDWHTRAGMNDFGGK